MSQESANEKKISPKKKKITESKARDISQHSESESPTKKVPLRRGSKQKHRMLSKKEKDDEMNNSDGSQLESPTRKRTKKENWKVLNKFYDLMELNRNQFLEDYVYDEAKR